MVISIKDKSQFVNGYLRPISALTEAIIIKNNDNKLECIANNEQGLIIYASYDIELKDDIVLNIPNVRKLEKVLYQITNRYNFLGFLVTLLTILLRL